MPRASKQCSGRGSHAGSPSGTPSSIESASPVKLRLACVRLLRKMENGGGSLTRLLPLAQQQLAIDDRAKLQAWSYGYCRWAHELRGLAEQLIDKPLKAKDADIYLLIQLGIFQLRHTSTAPHAAVDESVKVTRLLRKNWAGALVNAVLRNYQRRQSELENKLSEAARNSHPAWILHRLKTDWPEQWQGICDENNRQGPMAIRINTLQTSSQDYQALLSDADMSFELDTELPDLLTLDQPVPVERLPGFAQGLISVQDGSAQLAAGYIEIHSAKGGRLLDACSAPGGKTAHIVERQHVSSVLALDKDAERLERVAKTLQRLGCASRVELKTADAGKPEQWWDGVPFDTILLDAPCSGTGVIRRHPDIKLLRRETDIDELVRLQSQLLSALWPTLKPSGLLLYATCSVLRAENAGQVDNFLSRTEDAQLLDTPRQILPGEQGRDGFFYAPLRKISR